MPGSAPAAVLATEFADVVLFLVFQLLLSSTVFFLYSVRFGLIACCSFLLALIGNGLTISAFFVHDSAFLDVASPPKLSFDFISVSLICLSFFYAVRVRRHLATIVFSYVVYPLLVFLVVLGVAAIVLVIDYVFIQMRDEFRTTWVFIRGLFRTLTWSVALIVLAGTLLPQLWPMIFRVRSTRQAREEEPREPSFPPRKDASAMFLFGFGQDSPIESDASERADFSGRSSKVTGLVMAVKRISCFGIVLVLLVVFACLCQFSSMGFFLYQSLALKTSRNMALFFIRKALNILTSITFSFPVVVLWFSTCAERRKFWKSLKEEPSEGEGDIDTQGLLEDPSGEEGEEGEEGDAYM